MSTHKKTLAFAMLFTLSIASFCYINFCPSAQFIDGTMLTEVLTSDPSELQSVLPEFELMERIIELLRPVFQ